MTPLHAEVLEVARTLIRFDTSNAPESALGRPPGEETPAEGAGPHVDLLA